MAPWPNLLLQSIAIVCLVTGIFLVRKLKIKNHGLAMLVAVVLNAFSIIFVMLPSAVRILAGAKINNFTSAVIVHSVLGLIAEIVGVYFVWNWRFRKPGESCFRFRNRMKIVNIIWVGMFLIGIIIFYQLYF